MLTDVLCREELLRSHNLGETKTNRFLCSWTSQNLCLVVAHGDCLREQVTWYFPHFLDHTTLLPQNTPAPSTALLITQRKAICLVFPEGMRDLPALLWGPEGGGHCGARSVSFVLTYWCNSRKCLSHFRFLHGLLASCRLLPGPD